MPGTSQVLAAKLQRGVAGVGENLERARHVELVIGQHIADGEHLNPDPLRRGDIPPEWIAVQVLTVRDLLADNELDMPGTFEVLADAGYAALELGGDYDGRTRGEVRQLAEAYGLRVVSNHFGPRLSDPEHLV